MLPIASWPAEVRPFEPAYGWIRRLAERNYAYSTDSFVASLGLNSKDWDYEALLEIAGQLPIGGQEHLSHATPKRTNQGYKICGHTVPQRLFAKTSQRVCPVCLDESRHIRVWFDIIPVAACPLHDVALIGGLRDDPIDWRSTNVGCTRSGVFISGEHATPLQASKLDMFIVGALLGEAITFPEHLDGRSLQSILIAAMTLGRLYVCDDDRSPSFANIQAFSQLGFPALWAGPEATIEFLSSAAWLQADADRSVYEKRCDGAPKAIQAIPSTSLRSMLTDAFAKARIRAGIAVPAGRLSRFDGEDNLWNLKRAAAHLQLQPKALQKLLFELGVNARQCTRTHAHRLTASQITIVENFIAGCLSASEASRLLGCTADDVVELMNRKLLKATFCSRGSPRFQKAEIERFIGDVLKNNNASKKCQTTLLSSFAAQRRISLAETCSRILRKKDVAVADYDPTVPLFRGLLVSPSTSQQDAAQLKAKRTRPRAQVRNAMTSAQAAARIGTDPRGLDCLVRHGYIKSIDEGTGWKRICAASIEKFEASYVRASLFAPLLECPTTSALKILRKAGVQPINDFQNVGPKYVSRKEVKELTGLEIMTRTGHDIWELLGEQLSRGFALNAIPATVQITADPAIAIRATSGRWSFQLASDGPNSDFALVANFRRRKQHARLKRIEASLVAPDNVWPGAKIHYETDGGFVIMDEVELEDDDAGKFGPLVERCVRRALELHRLL